RRYPRKSKNNTFPSIGPAADNLIHLFLRYGARLLRLPSRRNFCNPENIMSNGVRSICNMDHQHPGVLQSGRRRHISYRQKKGRTALLVDRAFVRAAKGCELPR
ncbi:hypothetical protein TcCL_Unassigned05333, partial [Trypanosoma cruzi]